MRGGLWALIGMILAALFCAPPASAHLPSVSAAIQPREAASHLDSERRLCAAIAAAHERTQSCALESLASAPTTGSVQRGDLPLPRARAHDTCGAWIARLPRLAAPRAPPAA